VIANRQAQLEFNPQGQKTCHETCIPVSPGPWQSLSSRPAAVELSNSRGTSVFTFATSPAPSDLTEIPRNDIDKKLDASAAIKLRPNVATELYMWVLNPTEDKDVFTIEV